MKYFTFFGLLLSVALHAEQSGLRGFGAAGFAREFLMARSSAEKNQKFDKSFYSLSVAYFTRPCFVPQEKLSPSEKKRIEEEQNRLRTPTKLEDVRLRGVKWSGVDLSRLQASQEYLTSTFKSGWPRLTLIQSVLNKANLDGADISYSAISGSLFNGASFKGGRLCDVEGDFSSFKKSDLTGANATGARLRHTDFEDAQLGSSSFFWAGLNYSNFKNVKAHNANFEYARMVYTNFKGSDFCRANLKRVYAPKACFKYTDLRDADLSYACLSDADFECANFERANFERANFNFEWQSFRERFSRTNLQKVIARNACFKRAKLPYVDLSGAKLSGADFTNADLSGAKLLHVDLSGAKLSGANLAGALYSPGTNVEGAEGLTKEVKRAMYCAGVQNIPWEKDEDPDAYLVVPD